MQIEAENTLADTKMRYETPLLTVQGGFEALTQQDVDGRRFDASFNEGDPIPPEFAS